MVKIIGHNAASPPLANHSLVSASWRHYTPHLIYGFGGPHESAPQTLNLDQFSRFAGLPVFSTNTQTQEPRDAYDACSNRPHLCVVSDVA